MVAVIQPGHFKQKGALIFVHFFKALRITADGLSKYSVNFRRSVIFPGKIRNPIIADSRTSDFLKIY